MCVCVCVCACACVCVCLCCGECILHVVLICLMQKGFCREANVIRTDEDSLQVRIGKDLELGEEERGLGSTPEGREDKSLKSGMSVQCPKVGDTDRPGLPGGRVVGTGWRHPPLP